MIEIAKKLFYFYQRIWFYSGFAINEARKPLQLWNETLLIITFLTVQGIKFSGKEIFWGYLVIMFLASVIGKILIKTGVMRYNTTLVNNQSFELMEILKRLDRIEQNKN